MPRKKKGRTTEEAERLVSSCRDETEDSIKVLKELRDKAKSPNVRYYAARTLLEYGWGKPAMLENPDDPTGKMTDEELEKEYREIQEGKSKLPKSKKEK